VEYNYGKIIKYNGFTGEILAEDGIYLFLSGDVKDNNVSLNDDVIFRGEIVHNVKKAFFIRKKEKNNN
jgi:hypothetical protein